MLNYGRNWKLTFCIFIGHERQKLFWSSLRSLGEALHQILSLWFSYLLPYERAISYANDSNAIDEEIAVFMVFDIRLQTSSRISMRNRFVYDGWGYIFSSIMLTFFTETSAMRTSAPLRKHMWATMDQRYVLLLFQFQFALKRFDTSGSVNELLAFTQNICCVDVQDA